MKFITIEHENFCLFHGYRDRWRRPGKKRLVLRVILKIIIVPSKPWDRIRCTSAQPKPIVSKSKYQMLMESIKGKERALKQLEDEFYRNLIALSELKE